MPSTVIDQQPPPVAVTQKAYTSYSDHGSVGPLIAVLAIITVLGVIAGMIGRLCTGRQIMGHGQYDFEGWVERKCSTCLDGRIDIPHRPPPPANTSTGQEIPLAMPVGPTQEIKEEEEEEEEDQQQQQIHYQHHHHNSNATASET